MPLVLLTKVKDATLLEVASEYLYVFEPLIPPPEIVRDLRHESVKRRQFLHLFGREPSAGPHITAGPPYIRRHVRPARATVEGPIRTPEADGSSGVKDLIRLLLCTPELDAPPENPAIHAHCWEQVFRAQVNAVEELYLGSLLGWRAVSYTHLTLPTNREV